MRIAQVSFARTGGAGRVAELSSALLTQRGLDSTHLKIQDDSLWSNPYVHPLHSLSAVFDRYAIQTKNTRDVQFSVVRERLSHFREEIKNFDLVHLHWSIGAIKLSHLVRIADEQRIKVVVTLHDDFLMTGGCHSAGTCEQYVSNCGSCPLVRPILRPLISERLSKKVEAFRSFHSLSVIAPSQWIASRAQQSKVFEKHQIYKVYNPIASPYGWAAKTPGQPAARETGLTFGFVAANTLDPNKGLGIATRLTSSATPRINLEVVGGGRPEQSSGDEALRYLGKLDSSSLYSVARKWDALLICSRNENLPNVVVEMYLLGIPIISTATGGITDFLQEFSAGVSVPFEDFQRNNVDLNMLFERALEITAERNRMSTGSNTMQNWNDRSISKIVGIYGL